MTVVQRPLIALILLGVLAAPISIARGSHPTAGDVEWEKIGELALRGWRWLKRETDEPSEKAYRIERVKAYGEAAAALQAYIARYNSQSISQLKLAYQLGLYYHLSDQYGKALKWYQLCLKSPLILRSEAQYNGESIHEQALERVREINAGRRDERIVIITSQFHTLPPEKRPKPARKVPKPKAEDLRDQTPLDRLSFLNGKWQVIGLDMLSRTRPAEGELKPHELHGVARVDTNELTNFLVFDISGGVGRYPLHGHITYKPNGDYLAYGFSWVPGMVEYSGRWIDEKTLVFTSLSKTPSGSFHRFALTKLADGNVRFEISQSEDGEHFITLFDATLSDRQEIVPGLESEIDQAIEYFRVKKLRAVHAPPFCFASTC